MRSRSLSPAAMVTLNRTGKADRMAKKFPTGVFDRTANKLWTAITWKGNRFRRGVVRVSDHPKIAPKRKKAMRGHTKKRTREDRFI